MKKYRKQKRNQNQESSEAKREKKKTQNNTISGDSENNFYAEVDQKINTAPNKILLKKVSKWTHGQHR